MVKEMATESNGGQSKSFWNCPQPRMNSMTPEVSFVTTLSPAVMQGKKSQKKSTTAPTTTVLQARLKLLVPCCIKYYLNDEDANSCSALGEEMKGSYGEGSEIKLEDKNNFAKRLLKQFSNVYAASRGKV
ncbi:hypothetical protein BV898_01215 [Hypsibius exemplaris]|uniref:Uncharacterized protein n=1 Tax=Hypsibius exemplaris TaxID=2072580 RepID=A0A1W0XBX4_HYPEX|nr:hypothetical protein BV898_01215 [Hypsibius exemplaris]